MSAMIVFRAHGSAAAQAAADPWADRPEAAGPGVQHVATETGVLSGRVVDAATGDPLGGAVVHLVDREASTRTRADGAFVLAQVGAGPVTVSVRRVGYAPAELLVDLLPRDTVMVEIDLFVSALELPGIVVTGEGRERVAAEAYRPTTVIEGAELRRRLGSTVAATLSGEPGISDRYNGPAATQPVIRGLGGDRVLVLEDGSRTGDIAATAADHAVTVEPLTAERIEVVRGPAGVLYGSNALGGVINVIREEVPRSLDERMSGTLNFQAESVNRGVAGSGSVRGSVGRIGMRAEASGRTAGDTRTPLGALPSTNLEGYSLAGGASWVGERGHIGIAGRDYVLRYGVPGTFDGKQVPGAHAGGVGVALRRSAVRLDGAYRPATAGLHVVEVTGTAVRFDQDELERVENREFVGTEFGQLMASGRVVAHHHHEPGGLRLEGAVGASSLWTDFRAAGNNTGSRPAQQFTISGFAYEELRIGPLRVQAGGRYDWTRIAPLDTSASALLNIVRTRDFGAVSGSLAGLLDLRDGVTLGASLSRSFRTPAVEELFSDGPHLASYSFEIGNPSLVPEVGVGFDVFVRATTRRATAELTGFSNHVRNYIHYEPTGELDPRFRRYPVYRATQDGAVLRGVEGEAQWEFARGFVLAGQASYVHAAREHDGDPLPAIPPLNGAIHVRVERHHLFAGIQWDGVAAQRRTAEFEIPTGGYALLGAHAGVRWDSGGRFHTVTLTIENLTDAVWRDHLSRMRAVAPQPGRNLRLLYRLEL